MDIYNLENYKYANIGIIEDSKDFIIRFTDTFQLDCDNFKLSLYNNKNCKAAQIGCSHFIDTNFDVSNGSCKCLVQRYFPAGDNSNDLYLVVKGNNIRWKNK